MTKEQYLKLVESDNAALVADEVNKLSNEQRIALRTELENSGCKKLVRNLYYNYETQNWI